MKQPGPFTSLFVFQATLNPYLWFMAFVLVMPVLLLRSFTGGHVNLSSALDVPNLFFVGILGLWILAPELGRTQWTAGASSLPNSEFLLTLAVDRRVLYRSRIALFYLVTLLAPVLTLLLSLRSPDLIATEYEKQARLTCLHSVAGSTLRPDPSGSTSPLLHLPGGNVLVAEWHLWMFVAAAFLAQAAFSILFPWKHRLAVFSTLLLGTAFIPLAIMLMRGSHSFFPLNERLFFLFTGHQAIFWLASEVLFIAGQLGCEQRFIRQQY